MLAIQHLIRSMYSPFFIAKTRFFPIGKAIKHLFLLALLLTIPLLLQTYLSYNQLYSAVLSQQEFNDFTIADGQLSTSVHGEVYRDKHNVITFFPTKTSDVQDADSKNAIVFLKDHIFIQINTESFSVPYTLIDNNLSESEFYEKLMEFNNYILLILFVFAFITYFTNVTVLLVGNSFMAFVGSSVAKLLNKNMEYRHTWRLASFSLTNVVFGFIILNFFFTETPFLLSLLVFSIGVLFLVKAVRNK
jgi:hypothetical protein